MKNKQKEWHPATKPFYKCFFCIREEANSDSDFLRMRNLKSLTLNLVANLLLCSSTLSTYHPTYPNKCVSAAAAAKIMFYIAFILFFVIILFIKKTF
jgi:hypothetical protein